MSSESLSSSAPASSLPPETRGREARGRIVLIEDDPDIQDLIGYALTNAGFSVRGATSAREGIAAACRAADLILLDLNLPDADGLEVCRELRQRAASARVPILIVSARNEEIDRLRGKDVGATDFVVKPFSLKDLVAHCRRLVRPSE